MIWLRNDSSDLRRVSISAQLSTPPPQEEVKVNIWENEVFSVEINMDVLHEVSERPYVIVDRVKAIFDIKVVMQ